MSDPTGPTADHLHPTREDAVVASLSEVVGGPVGTRAGRGRSWWTPVRVLLVLAALTMALGMVTKTSCAATGWEDGSGQFTHLCYSDLPTAYSSEGLGDLTWPWADPGDGQRSVTAQPALVGLWGYAAAGVTRVLVGAAPDDAHARSVFTAVNAVGFAVLALLATAALAGCRRRRPFDAACFAVAPVLALAGLVSWDLLAAAAVAGALWAWTRGRPVLTGVLLGVGAAAGVWPVLVLVALGLVVWRGRGGRTAAAVTLPVAVSGLATWALLNAPGFLTGRAQWEVFWDSAASRTPDVGSVWTILTGTTSLGQEAVTVGSWALLGLWVAAVALLTLGARTTPRVSQVALLLVAGVLLLGVTYRPQQVLWLLPLAALARPRWRDLAIWQAGEVLYFALVWWYFAGVLADGSGDQAGFVWIGIAVRLACTLWLVAVVVRDVIAPAHDPVRVTDAAYADSPTRVRV